MPLVSTQEILIPRSSWGRTMIVKICNQGCYTYTRQFQIRFTQGRFGIKGKPRSAPERFVPYG